MPDNKTETLRTHWPKECPSVEGYYVAAATEIDPDVTLGKPICGATAYEANQRREALIAEVNRRWRTQPDLLAKLIDAENYMRGIASYFRDLADDKERPTTERQKWTAAEVCLLAEGADEAAQSLKAAIAAAEGKE